MQEPEDDYQPAEPEKKRIGLGLIVSLGAISILIFLAIAVLMVVPLPTPSSAPSEQDASTTEGSLPSNVEQQVKDIFQGDIAQAVKLSDTADDGEISRVDIELLSQPESLAPVKKWTKLVCQRCAAIFEENSIDRDISVWAQYEKAICGRTYYRQDTGEYEFTKAEDLEQ